MTVTFLSSNGHFYENTLYSWQLVH